ncbi:MAG: hypothetical protein K6L73_10120 [Cellvibrionaceae bacterium]
MKKPTGNTTKAVTVRLSMADYNELLHTAEKLNISIADTLRRAWREFKEQELQSQQRDTQTQELKRYIFESLAVTKNWDVSQRQTAIKRIHDRLTNPMEEPA